MNHLTVDEMIRFVSLTELNQEAVTLCAAVNGHIRKCESCREQVRAFQQIYDAFSQRKLQADFRAYAAAVTNRNAAPAQQLQEEPDGFR